MNKKGNKTESTTVKVKKTAKQAWEGTKKTAKSAWEGTKKTAKNAAGSVKAYTGKMKRAYEEGYAAGFEEAQNLPTARGAVAAATAGFSNGAKARRKSEKAKDKVTRIRARAKS